MRLHRTNDEILLANQRGVVQAEWANSPRRLSWDHIEVFTSCCYLLISISAERVSLSCFSSLMGKWLKSYLMRSLLTVLDTLIKYTAVEMPLKVVLLLFLFNFFSKLQSAHRIWTSNKCHFQSFFAVFHTILATSVEMLLKLMLFSLIKANTELVCNTPSFCIRDNNIKIKNFLIMTNLKKQNLAIPKIKKTLFVFLLRMK